MAESAASSTGSGTLHAALADHLRRLIISGELAVGDPLPSEARLCAEWGTSRGPVRQALATLRAEGLIGGGRGAPPIVRAAELSQPFGSLISFTTWAEQAGRRPGQRTIEVARRPAGDAVADALGVDAGEPVVQLLRLRLLDGTPVMLERTAFLLEVGWPLLTADLDTHSVYATLRESGTEMVTAHHVIDAIAADPTDADALEVLLGAPLLRERRRAQAAGGETVEFSDDRYRPDLVTFSLRNASEARSGLGRDAHLDGVAS